MGTKGAQKAQEEPRKVNLLDGNSLKTALDECARDVGLKGWPTAWTANSHALRRADQQCLAAATCTLQRLIAHIYSMTAMYLPSLFM